MLFYKWGSKVTLKLFVWFTIMYQGAKQVQGIVSIMSPKQFYIIYIQIQRESCVVIKVVKIVSYLALKIKDNVSKIIYHKTEYSDHRKLAESRWVQFTEARLETAISEDIATIWTNSTKVGMFPVTYCVYRNFNIKNISKYSFGTKYIKYLHWLPVKSHICYKILLTYKSLHFLAPHQTSSTPYPVSESADTGLLTAPPPQSADFLGQSLQRGSSHSLRLILSSLAIIATIILFLVLFVLSASTCVYLTLLKLCLSLRVKHLVSQFSWLLRSTLLSNLTWSMDTIPISAALDQLKSSRNTSVH